MKSMYQVKVSMPEPVGFVVRYRLLTANGTLAIRDFDSVDEVYDHIRWLVETGTLIERLRVEEVPGTKYVRNVKISRIENKNCGKG